MTIRRCTRLSLIVALLACAPMLASAQGTRADYERAAKFLPEQIRSLVYDGRSCAMDRHKWTFWYPRRAPWASSSSSWPILRRTRTGFRHEACRFALDGVSRSGHRSDAALRHRLRFTDDG